MSRGGVLQMLIMGCSIGPQMWHLLWFLSAHELLFISLATSFHPHPFFSPLQHFTDPRHSGTWRVARKQMPLVFCVTLPSLIFSLLCLTHPHVCTQTHARIIVNDVWLPPLRADLLLGLSLSMVTETWERVGGGWEGWGCCLEVRC